MASPQRPIRADADLPTDPRPQLQKRSPAEGKPPASRGWRFGYSWILLFLILGFWYVGFGWGDSGGWIWGHHNDSVSVANHGDLNDSGVAILEVANKQDYIGQSFQVRNVSVDHWSAPRAVWIGSRHSYLPMLLIFSSASPLAPQSSSTAGPDTPGTDVASVSTPRGAAGVQHLDVSGKIMKAPPRAEARLQWSLSDDDLDQLEGEGVYIQAMSVQLAKH